MHKRTNILYIILLENYNYCSKTWEIQLQFKVVLLKLHYIERLQNERVTSTHSIIERR